MVTKAVLVYQGGLANVFAVDTFSRNSAGRNAHRLRQAAFSECSNFAQGILAAGAEVRTAACNQAGDITNSEWDSDYDNHPFNDHFVFVGGVL